MKVVCWEFISCIVLFFKRIMKNELFLWRLSCQQSNLRRNFSSSTLTPLQGLKFRSELSSYEELYKFSCHDPNAFWGALGQQRITWFKKFDTVSKGSFADGRISWFLNGKLNVSGQIFSAVRRELVTYSNEMNIYTSNFNIVICSKLRGSSLSEDTW